MIHGESDYSLTNDEFLAALLGGTIMKIWGDNWRIHGVPIVPSERGWSEIESFLKREIRDRNDAKQIKSKILRHQGEVFQEYYRPKPPVNPQPKPDPGKVAIP